jgi:hypothetical protein
MKRGLGGIAFMMITVVLSAQQYIGSTGLIHVPTAEMDTVGMARVGAHYIPETMIPNDIAKDGNQQWSLTNYLAITPFRWIYLSYGYTLWRCHKNLNPNAEMGFYSKDRYFSLRLQPIQEGEWWPAVAIGGNDVIGSNDSGKSESFHYQNFYVSTSKHFELWNCLNLGTHATYRKWRNNNNHRWNGLVGGVTLSPVSIPNLRVLAEWDGSRVNVGADYRAFKYFLVQASLIDGSKFAGGLSLMIPLI